MSDTIELECEDCDSEITIILSDVYPGNIITCTNSGCNSKIQFKGDDGRLLQDALDVFDEESKNLGK